MHIAKPVTLASVSSLKRNQTLRDTTLKGFGARRRGKTVTYFVQTRINRRLRWFTIGTHLSPWTPETARQRARDILHAAQKNIDLIAAEQGPQTALTIEQVFRNFFEDREPYFKASTFREFNRVAKRAILPHFKNKAFASITRQDVTAFHRSLKATPGAANHALAILKQVFNWADANGLCVDKKNPCLNIQMFKSPSKAKFLTTDDVARLAHGCKTALLRNEATPFMVAAIMTLLFTGARRNEIFTLKRSYVDKQRMIAHLPDSKTGSKVLHLNPVVMGILDSVPEIEGNPYYFVGRLKGTCITEIYKPWSKIRKHAKLEHVRMHDLRHSFASFAADTGATAKTVGTLLGHASVETTKLYIHMFDNRAKETAAATAQTIYAAFNPAGALPLPQSRASADSAKHSGPIDHTEQEPFFPAQAG